MIRGSPPSGKQTRPGAEMLAIARSLPCSCRTLGEKATAGAAVALGEARETLAEDQRGKPGGLTC